jgi:hypothetical protein
MEQILESLSVIFIPPTKDRLALLLWCAFASAVFVLVYLAYRKKTLGRIVSRILESGATDPEKAVSFEAEEEKRPLPEKYSDRLVETVEKDGKKSYYIPEDRLKKAEYLLKASGGSLKNVLLSVLALYVCLVALYYFLPFAFPEYFSNF